MIELENAWLDYLHLLKNHTHENLELSKMIDGSIKDAEEKINKLKK